MKTICFVVPVFPTVSETFVTNQIVGAKLKGYSVRVLTYKLGDVAQSSQQELIQKHDILKDTIVIDYKIPKTKLKQLIVGLIPIIKYFKYWIRPVNISMKHRILNWPFLLDYYGKFADVDVFHVNFAMNGIRLSEMKQNGLLKAKLITTFHGHDAHYKNEKVLKKLQSRYKILFKVADYVTVNTPYLETNVLSLGCQQEKLHVIPMAIDVAYFNSDKVKELPNKSEIKLISVGRLIDFKGFTYAIEAIHILVNKGVNIHYTIVGEGFLLKSLQQQIKDLKLENHIKLVGKRSQDYIKQALDTHHIYLMSSITDEEGRSETQGVVTAEAQAMGLPVVAFNNGGIPYTIRDRETGFLVPEKDIVAYANAINQLIEQPNYYQKISKNAREFAVNNFSNELMIERFMILYEAK
jgi:colanic acid/amylovoran biosynthesis glycosyltransferase